MPCDTQNTITVDLGKADMSLLGAAMLKLYPGAVWGLNDGQLTITGRYARSLDVSAVKMEMSRQSVLMQAKRFGWSVVEKPNGQLLVQKGRL